MTRLGWIMLLGFAIVIAGFVGLMRRGGADIPQARSPAAAPPPPRSPDGLIVPVAGVPPAALADTWGDARGDGARAHHAIDVMAPRGTPVIAAAAGTVEKLFESKAGGHTIYIRRSDPAWQDYYAHLDRYAPDLREGMRISQGQRIGSVGASGDADPSAPHLHYEIHRMAPGAAWWKGTEIDPYPILSKGAG